jgi:hypothetical protein
MTDSDMSGDQVMSGDQQKSLLEVYLAEYQALTGRITYWIYLQYLSYSVVAVLIAVIVQAWSGNWISDSTRVWGGLLLLLFIVWSWVYATWEILNTTVYLEGSLRPKVEKLPIVTRPFWGWEPYLADQRRKGYNRYEWRFALLGFLFFIVPTIMLLVWKVTPRFCNVRSYGGWAGANLYVIVMISLRSREVSSLQGKLQQILESKGGDPVLTDAPAAKPAPPAR